jgi:hypothetical protein
MIERKLKEKVLKSLRQFPVVGIIGCRQVGKTTLAKMLQKNVKRECVYLDLELPSDMDKLHEPELYLGAHEDKLVIIDEIQRMPEIFPVIRALVDRHRHPGRFLILGSASPDLIKRSSESLAGRIIYHELPPFLISEINYDIQRLWLRGGLPESFLSNTDEESYKWRDAFIKTYLERDIPQLGIQISSLTLRRFWSILAHMHGQLWNASHIARALGVSPPTVRYYLDILQETFVVRQLVPYHPNIKKRLVKSPKIYIRDSGLLHNLLRIKTFDDLYGHPAQGASWEGFIIEQIAGILPEDTPIYFYRTGAGAEVDLIIMDNKNRPVSIEIKHSLTPRPEKGFWIAYDDLKCTRGFVIYPGGESYPLGKGVYTIPVQEIKSVILPAVRG